MDGGQGAEGARLERRLKAEVEGETLFDAFSRGRYATDASIFQILPLGVVVPRTEAATEAALAIAREEGVPVLMRGAGTSQCGQTVGESLVIDVSRHLDKVISVDPESMRAEVQPGIVLDELNRQLRPHGLCFPVDVSTASRATIGGMTGNNSCGSRSLRYGTMRDNVTAIEAVLADGSPMRFGPLGNEPPQGAAQARLAAELLRIAEDAAPEMQARLPALLRRVGGYNLDGLLPATHSPSGERGRAPGAPGNLAHVLIGSEGTLASFRRVHLKLSPILRRRVLGVCHFPSFHAAMDAAQHIVPLGPTAVELVDRTMIGLSRAIPMFRATTDRFVQGDPAALLLVEFSEGDEAADLRKLRDLGEVMGALGLPGAVVEATDPAFQAAIWNVRTEGLNIMMSMKEAGKPVSFVEDTAVPLEHLAEYTARLTEVFHRHGTEGTWYAHASEGCLHVRPVLNLKLDTEVAKMRAIAEAAFELIREYKGSHSGEHGDGLIRSEFNPLMFGEKLTEAHRAVKRAFDPEGRMNPGKIVDAPKMDDRRLFRYGPGYSIPPMQTALDWSEWGGIGGAVEMCNNNGACRKFAGGVMCPSFRVTREERDLTRGRANTLRLALSGQLGPDALASPEMAETMQLCVGCKGCKRECPTGVDMARLKIEVTHWQAKRHGLKWRDLAVAYLPHYAPWLSWFAPLVNAAGRVPPLRRLVGKVLGFAPERSLPRWAGRVRLKTSRRGGAEVVLLADTFNRWFEPGNLQAAIAVLEAAGFRVHLARAPEGGRPLCCGRTYLAAGLVDRARDEARRVLAALTPFVERGVPVVGLEPSCLLTLRDEYLVLLPGEQAKALAAHARLFEEFLEEALAEGRAALDLKPLPQGKAYLHGHCHQKAFAALTPVQKLLARIPGLEVETIESSCCGMAGAFGYAAETYDISMKMAELSLLPALREAPGGALVVADGTSCRHQIHDGAAREARHAAVVIRDALGPGHG